MGMGNTFGPGKQAGDVFISPGGATLGITGDHYTAVRLATACFFLRYCCDTHHRRPKTFLWSHANYMAQHLTAHWHSCWTLFCHLQEATHQNTPAKSMLFEDQDAWCPDHVVCRTRSADAGAPSGMLFNELKGQEFIFWMVAATSSALGSCHSRPTSKGCTYSRGEVLL